MSDNKEMLPATTDNNTPETKTLEATAATGSTAQSAAPAAKKSGGRLLLKLGVAMLLVSGVMTAGFYTVLQAKGTSSITVVGLDNGKLVNENRSIAANINKVDVSGPLEVVIVQNDTPALNVSASEGVLQHVQSKVDGDTLKLDLNGVVRTSKPIRVYLSLKGLQELNVHGSAEAEARGFQGESMQLSLRGSGDVRFEGNFKQLKAKLHGSGDMNLSNLDSDQVELEVTGSGDLNAAGKAKSVNAKLKGSGDLNASNLTTDTAEVELIGSGNVDVFAKSNAKVQLRGSGDVMVEGNPAQRTVSTHGSGDVQFH